jgi:DNA-binding transcriptional ArsR family regulator
MAHQVRTQGRPPANFSLLHSTSRVMHALAHPTRIAILAYIDDHQPVCVHQIYSALALEQSVTSQHLRLLRQTALVSTQRDGKYIYYTVNYIKMAGVAQTAQALAKLFDSKFEIRNSVTLAK